MAKLRTIYKIRAQIPAHVVEQSGLLSKACEIGLNLAIDDDGNVEGVWDASLLNLGMVLDILAQTGVEKPLIQRRAVALIVTVDPSKTGQLVEILRQFGASQSEDIFTGESVLRCNVSCEEAKQVRKRVTEIGARNVIATESFEVVAMPSGG